VHLRRVSKCLRSKGYGARITRFHGFTRLDIYSGGRLVASVWLRKGRVEKVSVLDEAEARRALNCFLPSLCGG
jgi:hypothetical protein